MTAHPSPQRLPSLPIARQPIWDTAGHVHGYEFLYRDADGGPAGVDLWAEAHQELASAGVLETLGRRVDPRRDGRSFVNVTRAFLVSSRPLPQHDDRLVLEVVESVPADDEVLAGIARLRALGYLIAIDDFTADAAQLAMLPYADYVKIDCRDLLRHGTALVELARGCGATLVAERVSDEALVERCAAWGFDLLQGDALGPATIVRI